MGERAKGLIIAVSLTILDAVVAAHYGGVIWQTWSGILWSRFLLVLLAALWAASLANVWAHAYYGLRQELREQGAELTINRTTISGELRGEGDV